MFRFWRIDKGLVLVKMSTIKFVKLFLEEIAEKYKNLLHILGIQSEEIKQKCVTIKSDPPLKVKDKPVIFVSACVDAKTNGGWKYNGGIKELNCLIKLLRLHGYESYLVTYDGKYEQWLIEHQPTISIDEFEQKKRMSKEIRCVTSWAYAKTFIEKSPKIYFWDMELAYSDNIFFALTAKLYKTKIFKTAGISRTIQAWHMSVFGKKCEVIPNLLDDSIWYPNTENRKNYNIGYMDEGPHTAKYIKLIEKITQKAGYHLNFLLIKGDEQEVLNAMRSCEVFLSMNIGKDPFWGEGCQRTILEAISVGCVSISFDVIGNREIIINDFNGFIVPNCCPKEMANQLVRLYTDKSLIDSTRSNAGLLIKSVHHLESRWPTVKKFLDL